MNGLVAWLTTILDKHERAARAVGSGAYPSYPWGSGDAELEFMEQHDPAAVLADIAAKRALLAPHRIGSDRWCVACVSADEYDQVSHELWPCTTVRLLASAYAAEPGYLEEWKP